VETLYRDVGEFRSTDPDAIRARPRDRMGRECASRRNLRLSPKFIFMRIPPHAPLEAASFMIARMGKT
jgi:hypothetical protein